MEEFFIYVLAAPAAPLVVVSWCPAWGLFKDVFLKGRG